MRSSIFLLCTLFLFMGCSKITVLRTQEVSRMQQENNDSLKAEIAKLQNELALAQEKIAKANHVETGNAFINSLKLSGDYQERC